MESRRAELVFVTAPGMGHLVSTDEVAKLLLLHNHLLSVTVIIFKFPSDSKTTAYTDSLSAATRINFVTVPFYQPSEPQNVPRSKVLFFLIEEKKNLVKDAVDEIVSKFGTGSESPRLAGFVIDMFCTSMIDVANEFGVPSYLFYTSSAAFLGFHFYTQELTEEKKVDTTAFKHSDDLLDLPVLRNRYPAKLYPSVMLIPELIPRLQQMARRFRETKGMMVNSFEELESYAFGALYSDQRIPPVYPVGPVLNVHSHDLEGRNDDVMTWLNDQPPMSVVFLCFGSMGSFCAEQVKEIAVALERSGHQFLWSLRRAPPEGEMSPPMDYENVEEVLPEGFLTRTAEIGKVIGWAPQVAVLGHRAVGGFVSHCGWNSTLESLWFGVPLAAWPMYAEQPFNAFEMVVELGLGVEVCVDYENAQGTGEANRIVRAAEIERAIDSLMEQESEVRKRVREIRRRSREALAEGGSSHSSMARFVQDVIVNMP